MTPLIAIPLPERFVYANYFRALQAFGAKGVKVNADADPADFDGLLLPGGADVDPARYGQGMNGSVDIDPALDEMQLAVLDRFYRAGKKILGICRGHQLINVYFGGTLIQDVANGSVHDWDKGAEADKAHLTHALPGSWLANIYGETFPTNSAHHQAVDLPGSDLIVDQWAEDGIVEGMHLNNQVFSVQWHPERMCLDHARDDTVSGEPLFRWFIAALIEKHTSQLLTLNSQL